MSVLKDVFTGNFENSFSLWKVATKFYYDLPRVPVCSKMFSILRTFRPSFVVVNLSWTVAQNKTFFQGQQTQTQTIFFASLSSTDPLLFFFFSSSDQKIWHPRSFVEMPIPFDFEFKSK